MRSCRPRGHGKAFKNEGASPPTDLKAFPGPRGRPDLKNAPNKPGQTAGLPYLPDSESDSDGGIGLP